MAKKTRINPTDAQWKFASEYVRNRSIVKALVVAYPKNAGLTLGQQRKRARQTMGMKGTKVAIQQLENDARSAQRLTVEQHMAKLEEIRDAAMEEGKYSVARAAEVDRGKCAGFYVERSMNMNVNVGSVEELRSRIAAFAEQHPQAAQRVGLLDNAQAPSDQSIELRETIDERSAGTPDSD